MFLDPLALLRTKFAFWFPPFSNRIRTEDSCPSARKIRARPHGRSASACAEVLQHPCGKSASFRAEQPRNSSEKVKFSVSCTVPQTMYVMQSYIAGLYSSVILSICTTPPPRTAQHHYCCPLVLSCLVCETLVWQLMFFVQKTAIT